MNIQDILNLPLDKRPAAIEQARLEWQAEKASLEERIANGENGNPILLTLSQLRANLDALPIVEKRIIEETVQTQHDLDTAELEKLRNQAADLALDLAQITSRESAARVQFVELAQKRQTVESQQAQLQSAINGLCQRLGLAPDVKPAVDHLASLEMSLNRVLTAAAMAAEHVSQARNQIEAPAKVLTWLQKVTTFVQSGLNAAAINALETYAKDYRRGKALDRHAQAYAKQVSILAREIPPLVFTGAAALSGNPAYMNEMRRAVIVSGVSEETVAAVESAA